MINTQLYRLIGCEWAWLLGALFILVGLWVKAILEWYFWDSKTHDWVVKHWKDWHYGKFVFWIGLYGGARFLIPPFLIYDIGLLFFQWGAFENGANFASMSTPYVPYSENGIQIFGLKNPKAAFVCLVAFAGPVIYRMVTV